MKRLVIILLSAGLLQANPEDNHPDIIQQQRSKSMLMADAITVEQVLEHAKTVYTFSEQLFVDVQGNPKSHVFAALGGAFVGVFIYKRVSSLGRANRKLDEVLKLLKAGGKDSRKNVIIQ